MKIGDDTREGWSARAASSSVASDSVRNASRSSPCASESGVYMEKVASPPSSMAFHRRLANILGLSMGWCLMVSVMFIQLSTSTEAARDYAGSSRATLPAGIMMAAATLSATPGTLLMQRLGRRPVLLSSALAASVGAGLMAVAARLRALWLLVLASVPLGVCFAQANNLRFAAVEFAPVEFEPRALSAVVTGAMLSAVVGAEVARHTLTAMDPPYVATYVFVTGLCLLYAVLVGVGVEFHRTAELVEEKRRLAAALAEAAAAAEAKPESSCERGASKAGSGEQAARSMGAADGGLRATAAAAVMPTERPTELTEAAAAAVAVAGPATGMGTDAGPEPGPALAVAVTAHSASAWMGATESNAAAAVAAPLVRVAMSATPSASLSSPSLPAPLPASPESQFGTRHRSHRTAQRGRVPPPPPSPPLCDFLCWEYMVPVVTAALAYGGMAGLMSVSPLAIKDAHYTFSDTTQVIQVHILAMFVPSLFTGDVIRALGPTVTMAAGAAVLLAGNATFFAGRRLPIFFTANAVVGIGWNWAYVGASAIVSGLLTRRGYGGGARFAAQGAMDTVVLAGTGVAVILVGTLYGWLGWTSYIGVYMVVNFVSVVLDGALLARMYGSQLGACSCCRGCTAP